MHPVSCQRQQGMMTADNECGLPLSRCMCVQLWGAGCVLLEAQQQHVHAAACAFKLPHKPQDRDFAAG
jgi:hypothetical protein